MSFRNRLSLSIIRCWYTTSTYGTLPVSNYTYSYPGSSLSFLVHHKCDNGYISRDKEAFFFHKSPRFLRPVRNVLFISWLVVVFYCSIIQITCDFVVPLAPLSIAYIFRCSSLSITSWSFHALYMIDWYPLFRTILFDLYLLYQISLFTLFILNWHFYSNQYLDFIPFTSCDTNFLLCYTIRKNAKITNISKRSWLLF